MHDFLILYKCKLHDYNSHMFSGPNLDELSVVSGKVVRHSGKLKKFCLQLSLFYSPVWKAMIHLKKLRILLKLLSHPLVYNAQKFSVMWKSLAFSWADSFPQAFSSQASACNTPILYFSFACCLSIIYWFITFTSRKNSQNLGHLGLSAHNTFWDATHTSFFTHCVFFSKVVFNCFLIGFPLVETITNKLLYQHL